MSESKRQAYDKIIAMLESQGIVEDSGATQSCSPALMVIQNNKPRFVVDFRKNNGRTPLVVYPLPRQTDIFNHLQDAGFISMFDLVKAFFQMLITEEDRHICTFSTRHGGAKQLTRSLMGYINSPAHCQRVINRIIKPYRWEFVIAYVDDIIVFSRTWTDHLKHIHWVLSELHKVGLTLDAAKSFIRFKSVNMRGHVVNRFGLATQEKKVEAMLSFPTPKNLQDVRILLGFSGYYRKFIRRLR